MRETEGNKTEQNIKLTVGILVSNRISYIRRVMESLKPLLEAVPSELIAVDTKGIQSDGSIEIVREYTDKVYSFSWCNDFAKARNVTLQYARGEWYLFLDDDEIYEDLSELIRFFQSGECEQYQSGTYVIKNVMDGTVATARVLRLWRNREETRFVGKIHEVPETVYKPTKQFQFSALHYGYYLRTDEEKKQHQKRNLALLYPELEEKGYQPRLCVQMAQELFFCEDTHSDGFRFCGTCLEQWRGKEFEAMQAVYVQWLLLARLRFCSMGNYKAGKALIESDTKDYNLSELSKLVVAAELSKLAYDSGEYEAAEVHLTEYFEWIRYCDSHRALIAEQEIGDLTQYVAPEYRRGQIELGVKLEIVLKQYEKAMELLKQLPWDAKEYDGSVMKEELLTVLREVNGGQGLLDYYKKIYRPEFFEKELWGYLPRECRELLKERNS